MQVSEISSIIITATHHINPNHYLKRTWVSSLSKMDRKQLLQKLEALVRELEVIELKFPTTRTHLEQLLHKLQDSNLGTPN